MSRPGRRAGRGRATAVAATGGTATFFHRGDAGAGSRFHGTPEPAAHPAAVAALGTALRPDPTPARARRGVQVTAGPVANATPDPSGAGLVGADQLLAVPATG